jgi:hypothetical protein
MAIDPRLELVVKYLISTQDKIGDGTFGTGQRPWLNFDTIGKVGQFDFAGVAALFTRNDSNDAYVSGRSEKKTRSMDLQSAKISADYLAGVQRDYLMRTRSRIRTVVHGGNRAKANGLPAGPIQRNTIDWLGRILAEQAAGGA